MPPTTCTADFSPVDFDHLARMTLGDRKLECEVLALFLTQSGRLLRAMAALPAETPALAHTLKGSAQAVGAFRVADCAVALEEASRKGENGAPALAALAQAVDEARAAIEPRLGPG